MTLSSSIASAPANLAGAIPSRLNPILGRDETIERIVHLLDRGDVRLLTLIGPGGVGKTRLALEIALRAGGDFAHGARFVPLASVRDPELVPFAVALHLGLQESGDLAVSELVTNVLGPMHLLLVLDNMEQVVGAANPWLVDLLEACPRLTVLVTSRLPLQISGDQHIPVPPLAVADSASAIPLESSAAVQLFLQRAQALGIDIARTPENLDVIAEICRRLDGLPLAIELAAARLNVLAPVEILARLTDRLSLLTGGLRDAPLRQRSMRDAISWSYDLLSDEERNLLCRLSVFVGGFSIAAADWTNTPDGENQGTRTTLDLLSTLVDHQLIRPVADASETRYTMLETIREFGLEMLAERGDDHAAQDAHAAWYLQLGIQAEPGLAGPDQLVWLDRLEVELANLRVVFDWLTSQDRVPEAIQLHVHLLFFHSIRAHFSEGRLRSEAWMSHPSVQAGTFARAQALQLNGVFAMEQGDLPQSIAYMKESLALHRMFDARFGIMQITGVLGMNYMNNGDLTRATDLLNESANLAVELGNNRFHCLALHILGYVSMMKGDTVNARTYGQRSLQIARDNQDPWSVAGACSVLAEAALHDEDFAGAEPLIFESHAISEAQNDRFNVTNDYRQLARLARGLGEFDKAIAILQNGVDLCRDTGNQMGAVELLELLGGVARESGDYARSLECLKKSLTWLQSFDTGPGVAECLEEFARLAFDLGDVPLAATFAATATALAAEAGMATSPNWSSIQHQRLLDAIGPELLDRAPALSLDEVVATAIKYEPVLPGGTAIAVAGEPEHHVDTHGLSEREIEVLRLMASGLSNQQIADSLFLSHRTATSHVTNILGKLELPSRTAAVAVAIRSGIA